MRLAALLLALVLMVPAVFAAAPQAGARPDHVADRDCLACHPDQASAWAESKHRHAMQPATAQTVLGDFGDVRFGEGAAAARFFRRGGDFVVAAQGADGRTQELAASHVFGIRPLQQVLLPQEGGRLQAFTIAWDTTRKTWFSLHTDGPVPPGDNLHWSGRYQNWNLMCGECHTTAYRKGYDDEHDRYATTWAEANVGCQACHGPGRAHAESAGRLAAAGERTQRPVATPNRALAGAHAQVDQCATCHARRTRLVEDAVAGAPLFDQFVPDNHAPVCITPTGSSSTRSSSTAPIARAACTRPAWPAPTATTPTAAACAPTATRCAPPATTPRPTAAASPACRPRTTTRPRTTSTAAAAPAASASTATCRAATTWSCTRAATTPSACRAPT